MELIEITPDGIPARTIEVLPEIAAEVMKCTAEMYQANGYQPPWTGYLAIDQGICIGTRAFKTPPVNDRAEIAYFTFPGNEGCGVATSMVEKLLELAKERGRWRIKKIKQEIGVFYQSHPTTI